MAQTKTGFVVMPFSPTKSESDWTEIYTEVFQSSLHECGYTCTRAEVSTGNLITSIIEQLIEADIVIVDVTDRNANVFYELGVRHALRRGTIIVSQSSEHVPSDLKGYWFLTYGLRPAQVKTFKTDIRRVVDLFEKDPLKSDNPVSDFLDKTHRSSVRETNRDNLKKLGALVTELSGNRLALKQQVSTGKPQLVSVGCMELLLQTRYLDVGPEMLKRAYELEYHLEVLRRGGNVSDLSLIGTINELETFSRGISEIREGVSKGEFAEPTTISMMTWSPLDILPIQVNVTADRSCSAMLEPNVSEVQVEGPEEVFFSQIELPNDTHAGAVVNSASSPDRVYCMACGNRTNPGGGPDGRVCMVCGQYLS